MSITLMVLFGFIIIVYLIVGFIITKSLIKRDVVESATDFWFFFILWLPIGIVVNVLVILKFMWRLPKKLAESQINKHTN